MRSSVGSLLGPTREAFSEGSLISSSIVFYNLVCIGAAIIVLTSRFFRVLSFSNYIVRYYSRSSSTSFGVSYSRLKRASARSFWLPRTYDIVKLNRERISN